MRNLAAICIVYEDFNDKNIVPQLIYHSWRA